MISCKWRLTAGTFASSVAWALITSLLVQPCGSAMAQTQVNCSSKLKQAEQKFIDALFDDVIALVEPCVRDGDLALEEKGRAYELLSKTYVAQAYIEQARSTIRKLLELVPNYSPNPERDTPPFIAQVEQMKEEMRAEKEAGLAKQRAEEGGFPQTWHLLVGGAVIAGVIVAVVAGNGNGAEDDLPIVPNPLPGPPSLP